MHEKPTTGTDTTAACTFEGCERRQERRCLCSSHYRQWQRKTPLRPLWSHVLPVLTRFWLKVDKSAPAPSSPHVDSPCWTWTAGLTTSGYGGFRMEGAGGAAHRASWVIHNGPIPKGMHVLHRCDVRHCVRPSHLFIGTNADNMADMMAKGRKSGDHVRGARNHSAKLNPSKVRWVRLQRDRSAADVAAVLGVSPGAIRFVRSGHTWKHVKPSGPVWSPG